jgi:deazaflavin-dependent oxidoreductase (nitroreductase family)
MARRLPRPVYIAIGELLVSRPVTSFNRWLLRRTSGRIGAGGLGMDVILVTTRGRRSGQARTVPLGAVLHGADWIVIGSNAGHDKAPAWALNMRADPEVPPLAGGDRGLPRLRRLSDAHRTADPAVRARAGVSGPGRPGPLVQVFGLEKDQATRAAQRFFKERRVDISFVDLRKRPIAPGELRRFVERLGARALLDEGSRAYRDGGLAYLRMDDAEIVERLLAEPSLLVLPLVRHGNDVTAGRNEATWKAWVAVPPG